MVRLRNRTASGGVFAPATIWAVWCKGTVVAGYDPNRFRKDRCGMWMAYADYGKQTEYGWEIDHIQPVSRGGSDHIANLQPLHWRNNHGKSDHYPNWGCTISAN